MMYKTLSSKKIQCIDFVDFYVLLSSNTQMNSESDTCKHARACVLHDRLYAQANATTRREGRRERERECTRDRKKITAHFHSTVVNSAEDGIIQSAHLSRYSTVLSLFFTFRQFIISRTHLPAAKLD